MPINLRLGTLVLFAEKVEDYFEVLLLDQAHYRVGDEVALVLQSFCDVISRINRASESVGKDGRFQLFICVGVRYAEGFLRPFTRANCERPSCPCEIQK